ncbi:MAG: TetR family transcriptional regulator [Pseudonocardiales bacterium]|nr:MAG: TetR family transcriptional regulator [Pseudonocardiales bacterium]
MAPQSAPRTARARARDELSREIKDAARRQLAEHGAAGLSLRAVAREMGMVSSAIYRYFPSRDDLLTALIIDSYDALGTAAEQAEAGARRGDFPGRWMAVVRAARRWALARPQEWALIFGSPVPGYQAPSDTVDPAARIPLLVLRICSQATAAGHSPPPGRRPMPRPVRSDMKALGQIVAWQLSEADLARAVLAWTELIGSISFELFGHLHGVVRDYEPYFDYQMRGIGEDLGLVP